MVVVDPTTQAAGLTQDGHGNEEGSDKSRDGEEIEEFDGEVVVVDPTARAAGHTQDGHN